MKLIVQPHDARVGELLVEDLRSKRYHTFLFCAAYAKLSGVSALDDALREFTSNGGATYALPSASTSAAPPTRPCVR